MTRGYLFFIQDILKAINDIDKFVGNMDFEEFCKDGKTKSAIVWQIHIIGEATKNVPKSITDRYKEVPWKYMARIRDKIAHLYFGIDYEIVWDVVKNKFPEVKPLIEKILKEIKE